MDLQEWELLPDDGFLEIHDDGGKQIFSRKYGGDPRTNIFNTNYFICPSQKSPNPPGNLPIVPIRLAKTGASTEKALDHDELVIKEVITKVPIDQEEAEAPPPNDIIGINVKSDREPVSQVFFKKMEENEFVDMKMDSPRSSGRGVVVPQIDAAGIFQFEEEKEIERRESTQSTNKKTKKTNQDSDSNTPSPSWDQDKEGGAVNIWKWSLTGIGAICSFGVAAATVCIIIYGTHQKNKQQQNQKLRFQIYAEDKRMKEAVHQATKLNEAISSAVRGVPLSRGAQIALGGYYDGL